MRPEFWLFLIGLFATVAANAEVFQDRDGRRTQGGKIGLAIAWMCLGGLIVFGLFNNGWVRPDL